MIAAATIQEVRQDCGVRRGCGVGNAGRGKFFVGPLILGYPVGVRIPTLRSAVALGSLVLAALALSHHLIYFLAHGDGPAYARAMNAAGHDRYWATFLVAVGVSAGAIVAISVHQLRRLSRLADVTRNGGLRVDDGGLCVLLRMIANTWLRVAAGTIVAYLLQENLETLSVGISMPGLGVISGELAFSLPVIALVALLVATVQAIAKWRRNLLLARLRVTVPRYRAGTLPRHPLGLKRRPRRVFGPTHGERAPPNSSALLV